ncbi:MAG: aminotransferase class IV family protein [Bacteroidales bacterium]|nr:aminotransferase class IV family protein [Bacteroidales bacterium]MBN2821388.1 aminotransferase class IV family protein [Bacteroidales bacterium]
MDITGNWFYFKDDFYPTENASELIGTPKNSFYEVLRVVKRRPLFFEDHFERFEASCKSMNLHSGIPQEEIHQLCLQTIQQNNVETANLKFELLVFSNSLALSICLMPHYYPKEEDYKKGVKLTCYKAERPDPHVKQSVINNKIKEEISDLKQKAGAYEVLLLNHDDEITEGSRSNIFFIQNNRIVSPPSGVILEGITRKKVLSLTEKLGIGYMERPVKLVELTGYEAVFLTGTSPKILPVAQIHETEYLVNHPIIIRLIAEYEKLINEYCA